jgi:ankyrin repeat protein
VLNSVNELQPIKIDTTENFSIQIAPGRSLQSQTDLLKPDVNDNLIDATSPEILIPYNIQNFQSESQALIEIQKDNLDHEQEKEHNDDDSIYLQEGISSNDDDNSPSCWDLNKVTLGQSNHTGNNQQSNRTAMTKPVSILKDSSSYVDNISFIKKSTETDYKVEDNIPTFEQFDTNTTLKSKIWDLIESGTKTQLKDYLKLNPNDANIVDQTSETPLFKAASLGKLPICKVLLQFKANINWADKLGNTVMHLVCKKRLTRLAILLASQGGDIYYSNLVSRVFMTKFPFHM